MVTSALKLMYRDCDLMDQFPEISAAMDLISEESCLFSDTKIKLLNGNTLTIEELYKMDYKDFWLYSIDENGIDCKPTKIEKVVHNGVKPLLKITLDDGTEIKCTENHRWLLSNNTWVEADKLIEGDSLLSIYDSKNNLGYEQIISTNGSKNIMTHKMVAENVFHDKKIELSNGRAERNEPYQKIVIHHKSFDKLNNNPNELVYMFWNDHIKLHTTINTERWKDAEFATKMKKVLKQNFENFWYNKEEEGIERINKAIKERTEKHQVVYDAMTQEEKNEHFGRKGKQNGMYGTNRSGVLSPRYDHNAKRPSDLNEEEYVNYILTLKGGECTKKLMEKFSINKKCTETYNGILAKKYGVSNITELKYKLIDKYSITNIKGEIRKHKNPKKYTVSGNIGIEFFELEKVARMNGYENWEDLVKNVNNHRIIKIEKFGEGDVYDLINSSNNNCFGVKCNTGQIISHNCTTDSKGQILKIHSNSKRVKQVLEDLFVNRLDIHINLPMWTRSTAKYGNCFVMLNITAENGVIGARQLPVYEVDRVEAGMYNPYVLTDTKNNGEQNKTEFVWAGKAGTTPFQNWQIAHFRLLTDSLLLPYGVSFLHKARRHWRILSMMEDMMLIYRLERSIERRIFKIFVGNIDDADIPAYMNEIANSFKRTPIIDPQTGQVDLRKASLATSDDIFMPYKTEETSSKIETLQSASNLDKIEDLKYIQGKVMTALRVPGAFLNYEQAAGNGKNLALLDIRFTRTINRIQQAMIMELTKIAAIHLFTIGLGDELNNFKITMNSPSTQSEILKLEELSKKVSLVTDLTRDLGNGLQVWSLTRAQREVMGMTDEEISENMLEIRMEKALASELTKTDQDGLEDGVDMGGAGGGGGGGFDDTFGGGGEESPDMGSEMPETGGETAPPTETTSAPEENSLPPMESFKRDISKLLVEKREKQVITNLKRRDTYYEAYVNHLKKGKIKLAEEEEMYATPIVDQAFLINEQTISLTKDLDSLLNKKPIDLDLVIESEKIETKKSKKNKK